MSQQWGCEEVEDNCIQDKDTYHMRVFHNGDRWKQRKREQQRQTTETTGNNGDNGFFFYAYGRTNKIYFFDSSIKRSYEQDIFLRFFDLAAVC